MKATMMILSTQREEGFGDSDHGDDENYEDGGDDGLNAELSDEEDNRPG